MARTKRTPHMKAQFEELRQAIVADLSKQVEASEGRLREGLSKDVVQQVQASEQRLREDLSKDVAQQVQASERRLREDLSKDVAQQVQASERRLREDLSKDIAQQITATAQQSRKDLSTDVADQLETAGRDLAGHMQVHVEELKDLTKKAAEGYGGVLDGIRRDLKEFRDEWRKKDTDTQLVLANHNSRISSLEQTREHTQPLEPR